jgi:hypothetical protein
MALAPEPELPEGSPIIFFDSHPEEQAQSYLYSGLSWLGSQLHIAFTGQVPRPHLPGNLRVIWYTTDGNQGLKDYQLHEYAQVRENFDELLKMDEIRRVVIMGYPSENPYVVEPGGKKSKLAKQLDKKMQRIREDREDVKKNMEKDKAVYGADEMDEHIDSEEEEEEFRELEAKKEGDGLLSGVEV